MAEKVGKSLAKGWRRVGERLAKGWRRVGEGLAKGWRRVTKGLAGFLAPSNFAIPEASMDFGSVQASYSTKHFCNHSPSSPHIYTSIRS